MIKVFGLFIIIFHFATIGYGANCQFSKIDKQTRLYQNPSNKSFWIASSERSKAIFQYLQFKLIDIGVVNLKANPINLKICQKKSEYFDIYTNPIVPFAFVSTNSCEDQVVKKLSLTKYVTNNLGSMEAPGELVSIQELLVCPK